MVQVIILAGGMGKRMLTDVPKVLVPFHHKPMIVHVIRESLMLDATQILVVVGKTTGVAIQNVIEKWFPNDKNIQYVMQENPQGTGHAVLCCLPHLQDDEQTIILSGDVPNINHKTLRSVFQLKSENNVVGRILAFEPDDNVGYGRVVEVENNLLYICEEKDCTDDLRKITLCNAGIYCITSASLKQFIPNITNQNKANEYYLPDMFNFMLEEHANSVKVCIIPKKRNIEVMGINTQAQLEHLEKESLKRMTIEE